MTRTARRSTLVFAAAAATMIGFAAVGVVSAAAGTTEPTDTASMGTAVEDFCAAEVAVEAAANSGDPAVMGPAVDALRAAAPDDIRPTVEDVIANVQAGPG